MADSDNRNIMEKERDILSEAIIAHNVALAAEHASSLTITPAILALAKKTLNKVRSDDEKFKLACKIYGNLLEKADFDVLEKVYYQNAGSVGEGDIALDVKYEMGRRELYKAINNGDVDTVRSLARREIIREVINEDHLKLAIKKHDDELPAGKTDKDRSNAPRKTPAKKPDAPVSKATQIVKILFQHTETPVLEALKQGSSWSVTELIKEELASREIGKNHPLNRWLT